MKSEADDQVHLTLDPLRGIFEEHESAPKEDEVISLEGFRSLETMELSEEALASFAGRDFWLHNPSGNANRMNIQVALPFGTLSSVQLINPFVSRPVRMIWWSWKRVYVNGDIINLGACKGWRGSDAVRIRVSYSGSIRPEIPWFWFYGC